MAEDFSSVLNFSLFGVPIRVDCAAGPMRHLIESNFSAFLLTRNTPAALDYRVGLTASGLYLTRLNAGPEYHWSDLTPGECLFLLEKDLTIEVQKRRGEWYFLHAAALGWNNQGLLLVGRSGGGKSTTCWGLLQHGCAYLSDELAPIDLQTFGIQPYPHALCLKNDPPDGYALPSATLRTEATMHIPVTAMPGAPVTQPLALATLVFIEHMNQTIAPVLTPVSSAEAGALLYAQALNPLSHPDDGLDAALRIAGHCRCLRLTTGRLTASIDLLLENLNQS